MHPRDLLPAFDAYRPGESLADDPALADIAHALETDAEAQRLRQRVEQADRRIAAAMQAIESPAGLADRLLVRLAQTQDSVPVELPQAADTHRAGSRIRRRALLATGVAAAAAAVMIAIQLWPKPEEPWTAEQLLEAAIGLYTRDARTGNRPLAEHPNDLPPSDDLVRFPPNTQWRWIDEGLADSDVAAYDIELFPGGPRATQYAFDPNAEVTGLPDAPPPVPSTPTTQGVCAAAWQHRGVVYVLVVEGGPREYRQFLRNRGGEFAGKGLRIEDRGLRG